VAQKNMSETVQPLKDYINGEFSTPTVHRGIWLENPNTKERLQEQMATDEANIEKALESAQKAHESGVWSEISVDERCAYLAEFSAAIDKRKDEISRLESLTTGVPISLTTMFQIILTGAWHLANEQLKSGWTFSTHEGFTGRTVEVHRKPLGVALCLVPWNAPAPMAVHKAANSLAAGCPTILKPTEWSPNGCDVLAEAAHEAKLPKGVFQIVHGGPDVGGKLVKDSRVRAVSFTGGLEGGRAIARECAFEMKPAQLELGGNNNVIVLEDADLDKAAQGVIDLMTSLNGQWCRALGRLLVHESIAESLLERIFEKMKSLKIGDSLSFETQMGPMVHSQHLAKIKGQLDELIAKGGTAHSSANLPDLPGNFIAPTLITGVKNEDAQHEIFGPIGTVHTFKNDDEAAKLANSTPYGLEGYVFCADEERGLKLARKVRAGGVKVNGSTVLSLSLFAPRGAWGLSGLHDEGTIETFQFFCGTQVVGVEGN
jgi:acyl-CoA reductase-like NAD-dependent aldehyde dehydrogenase